MSTQLIHTVRRKEALPQQRNKNISVAIRDPLQVYVSEIKQFRLLTRDEEKALVIRYKETGDKQAARKLITSNLRLVVKIALDYHRSWARSIMDLIQEGNLGLVKAVNRFDPDRGTKFSNYAAFWIKAYILKFLLDNWRLVKIGTTQNQRKLFYGLQKEKEELLRKGIHPEPILLAEHLGVKEEEVIEMGQRLRGSEISMDSPNSEGTEHAYLPHIADQTIPVDEQMSHKQLEETLSKEIRAFRQTLSGREAFIFESRIMSEEPMTLQKIGEKYHISRERVRQVQQSIIRKITEWLSNEIPNFRLLYGDMVG